MPKAFTLSDAPQGHMQDYFFFLGVGGCDDFKKIGMSGGLPPQKLITFDPFVNDNGDLGEFS